MRHPEGTVRPNLFKFQDEEVPVNSIVASAEAVLAVADKQDPPVASKIQYHIDSPEWRTWSNPEFLLSDKGVRLEDISDGFRDSILALLKATLSPEGYEKAIGAM